MSNDNILCIGRSSTRLVYYNTRLHIIITIILYADPYNMNDGGPSAENDTSHRKKN